MAFGMTHALPSDRTLRHLNFFMTPTSIFFTVLLVSMSLAAHAADIERGRTIYSQLCFNCHGPHLEGGQGPALTDGYWQHGSSPEAILNVINKGVAGSPMIPYEAVFSESDRLSLRDFILSHQEGLREVVRSVYPRQFFRGKRFTPELFDAVESETQTPLPENWYYMDRNAEGVMRGTSKLYIREAGDYQFAVNPVGRTSIFLNGEEVFYFDEATDKKTHFSKKISLEAGAHDLDIFHEEKTSHSYRFNGTLRGNGKVIALNGRSLEGNIPVVIKARPGQALVVRKWIDGLPPRALLCLLPNSVIVAYDSETGQVLKAWHSAEINQTPSLPDRSAKPSEIKGEEIAGRSSPILKSSPLRFLRYEMEGEAVRLVSQTADGECTVRITPEGQQSFKTSVQPSTSSLP